MWEVDRFSGEVLAFVMGCIWRHIFVNFVNSEGIRSEGEVFNEE